VSKDVKEVKAEIRALLEEAYRFGYFVGYRGHSDWTGWARERREEMYQKAERLGVYELVKKAYRRGKDEGSKRREEEIHLGLIEKGRVEIEGEKPAERQVTKESEEEEEEFTEFLRTAKLVLPPEFLNTLKYMEIPRMLRMGGE